MAANEPGQPALERGSHTHNLAVPTSALAIGAHPDDVEFGCGATLAKWADHGCIVHHLICTDGSKGTWDVHADTVALEKRVSDALGLAVNIDHRDPGGTVHIRYRDLEQLDEIVRRLDASS